MKKEWLIKTLALVIVVLFIGVSFQPILAIDTFQDKKSDLVKFVIQNTNEIHDITSSSFFGLQSVIMVSWDENQTSQPIMPYVDFRVITLNVSFSVIKGFLGQFILRYCILTHQSINVTIEIDEKPDYCKANITNSNLRFSISDTLSMKQTKFTVWVNENATAFEPFNVTIKASLNDVPGPFGFFTFINEFEQIQEISLIADYFSLIDVSPENSVIETTPGTTVVDPIIVENLGNGKTIVDIEFDSAPENWSITVDPMQLILEVKELNLTNLSVTPPFNFTGTGFIRLSFTPKFFYNPQIQGQPHLITIAIEVYPEEKISFSLIE